MKNCLKFLRLVYQSRIYLFTFFKDVNGIRSVSNRTVNSASNGSQVELVEDEDRIVRNPKRRKRNVFLDDEADCEDMDDDQDEEMNEFENDFIDDSDHSQGSQEILANKRREIELNKIALLTYLKELTNEELENLGMKFDLTQIEDLFQ